MGARPLSVLVVDDEPEMRHLLLDILEGAGHRVACAPDGPGAAQLVADRTDSYDLAFVDYVMPGGDGLELMECLRRLQPGLRVVLVTGETELEIPSDSFRSPPYARLTKPFSLSAVEDLLDRL